ncbi:tRNA dimethylallyltransferase 9 [Raphanus sativus]|uniref:tRNA dimethylallyltransferase n=1 Tax=Raphanus sativus TaxID=3726 RepID=A0A6J0MTZ1_RAPSA|nr:tRNA dimethylallyltransferase 9 [Raphanus sativus]KAJ4908231.1 tRNA dimethylallyltransferase 9 [Raphanus sativus]
MVISCGVFSTRSCCSRLQPPCLVLRRRLCGATACSDSVNGSTSNKKRNSEKEKVIVISGPTGAGKSRLALELAKRLNGEIISADSVQVYKGLDVGSAKPSASDRKEVPHHLIDILHPSQDYSVGQFFEDGRQATKDILSRGRVPIVTGGTGLYLRWFMYGKPDVPKPSPEIISKVHDMLVDFQTDHNWDAAVEFVVNAGDQKASSLPRNDWYRLKRSLEILKTTGSPPSSFRVPYDSFRESLNSPDANDDFSEDGSSGDISIQNIHTDLDYDFLCFFLSSPRIDLYRSIDFRCEDMLSGANGVLSEARWLLDLGLLPNTNSATRAIGYRQAMEYLSKCRRQGGVSSPGEFYGFLNKFQQVSRNFAKRQMTWFRCEPMYHWLNASKPLDTILEFIYHAYEKETETLVVPDSIRMNKDMRNSREANALKAYRPRNRHFIGREDCSSVLEWIRSEGCKSEVSCVEGAAI